MTAILSVLLSFTIYQLLFGIFYGQMGSTTGAFATFFTERPSVPLILLSAGQPIHIFTLWLAGRTLAATPVADAAFPRLFVEKMNPPGMARTWEVISALVMLALPIIGFGYYWVRFLTKGEAWLKANAEQFGLFHPAPFTNLFVNFDQYRYGDLSQLGKVKGVDGVSFVPLWQPLIMVAFSLAIVVMSLRLFLEMRNRRRAQAAQVTPD